MYNIPMGKYANPTNRLGIYEAEDELYVQSDMDKYVRKVAPHVPQNFTPVVYEIDGTHGISTDPDQVSGFCLLRDAGHHKCDLRNTFTSVADFSVGRW